MTRRGWMDDGLQSVYNPSPLERSTPAERARRSRSSTAPEDQPFAYSHTQTAGGSVEDFLGDSDFARLTIEIFLDESIPSPGQSPYSADEIRTIERVIRNNSGRIGQPDPWVIEATSIRHEIGHVLGLVNIRPGTPPA